MEYRRSEITAGLMIVISSVLLLSTIAMVGNIGNIFQPQKTFIVLFPSSGGLVVSAPVLFAGVTVGRVTEVRIAPEYENQVAVSVEMVPEVEVKEDSRVMITSQGFLGEVFVAISPGSPAAPLLPEGGILQGVDPLYLTDLMQVGNDMALTLQKTLDRIYQMVGDPATEASIKETLAEGKGLLVTYRQLGVELQEATRGLNSLLGWLGPDLQRSLQKTDRVLKQVDGLVEQNRENILASMENLKRLTGNLNQAIVDNNHRVAFTLEAFNQKIELLSQKLTLVVSHLDGLVQKGTLVVNENRSTLFLIVQDLKETSQNLKELSDTVKKAPWKLIKLFGRDEEEASDPAQNIILQDKGQVRRYGKQ